MRYVIFLILLLVLPAAAQPEPTNVEIVFWESVRNSTDPADFRAYLEKYPQGNFAALARNRLAVLGQKPAAAPDAPAPPPAKAASRLPSQGDTWTYRLYEPERNDGPKTRSYSAKIASVSASEIVEHFAIDGGPAGEWTHKGERQVVTLGKSVFAPYLPVFGEMPSGAIGRVQSVDPSCGAMYICEAVARVVAWERVAVPAGTFDTVKVEVRQHWRPTVMAGPTGAQNQGGRILTGWYAPAVKRAVKFSSRPTFGAYGPIDTNFDLELVSYQVK